MAGGDQASFAGEEEKEEEGDDHEPTKASVIILEEGSDVAEIPERVPATETAAAAAVAELLFSISPGAAA